MTSPDILQQLDRLDKNSPRFPDQLTSLLYDQGFKGCIPELRDEDVVWLVKYLDKVLDSLDPSGPAFRKCLSELGRICGTREKLPPWYILEGSLSIPGRYPVASGGSGDVYEGLLSGSRICVKRLRIYAKEELQTAKKTFHREAVMWRHLTHPNIVPLLGITLEPLQLISTWIPGGELKDYIIGNPDTDRLALLSGIADGLNYLHSRNIVHGDLKGPNILVDDSGCPQITDFGLAMVTQNQDSVRSAQGEHAHTARWTAPEILNEQGSYSKEADVFSFAMVMVETFTGEVPFHPALTSSAILAILDKKRPARPKHSHLTSELWALMGRCWNQDRHLRPEMSEVLGTLRGSDSSPKGPFKKNLAMVITGSQMPVEFTDQKAAEQTGSPKFPPSSQDQEPGSGTEMTSPSTSHGESAGQSGDGSTQMTGSFQAATHPQTRRENDLHHSEEQEEQSSGPAVQNQPRRGTDQSELYTPLPIDPVQVDSKELLGWTGKSHIDLLSSLDKGDSSRENTGNGPRNDSKCNNIGGIHNSESQGSNYGASQHSLQDPDGNPTRSILGRTDDVALTKSPSETRPPDVNTGSNTSRHVSQTGTKSCNQPQTNLDQTVWKDPPTDSHLSLPQSRFGGWKADEVSSRLVSEPHRILKNDEGKQGSREALDKRTHDQATRQGFQPSATLSPVTVPPPKNHGMWCRFKRKFCCTSDESTST